MDLSKMGYREMGIASDILKSITENGYPEDFDENGIDIGFNPNSGCVYLTNAECQSCMMNEGKLEMFHTCFECGEEGFVEDFIYDNNGRINNCCMENISGLKEEIKNQKLEEILK